MFEIYADTKYTSVPYQTGYVGIKLSDLATQKNVGFTWNDGSYDRFTFRKITHSGTNELTFTTGTYGREGGSGTDNQYCVPIKIYGMKL